MNFAIIYGSVRTERQGIKVSAVYRISDPEPGPYDGPDRSNDLPAAAARPYV